jgi:hypothetical protein
LISLPTFLTILFTVVVSGYFHSRTKRRTETWARRSVDRAVRERDICFDLLDLHMKAQALKTISNIQEELIWTRR